MTVIFVWVVFAIFAIMAIRLSSNQIYDKAMAYKERWKRGRRGTHR